MEDLDLSGVIGAIILQVRKRWPGVDGLYVLLLAAVLSVFFVFASAPEEWRTKLPARSMKVFGLVAGGFSLVGYAASKLPQPGGAG